MVSTFKLFNCISYKYFVLLGLMDESIKDLGKMVDNMEWHSIRINKENSGLEFGKTERASNGWTKVVNIVHLLVKTYHRNLD